MRTMKMKKLIGPIGAFIMVVAAPMAHADLKLTYQITGDPLVDCGTALNPNPQVLCTNTPGNLPGAPLQITGLTASSTSPGDPSGAEEDSTSLHILNNSGAIQTITISVASNGFMNPTAPPTIEFFSNIGGSVIHGSDDNKISFQSCGDLTNSLNGCPGSAATVPVTPDIRTGGQGGFWSAGDTGFVNTLAPPYSIDELIVLTLGAGAEINFSASTTLIATPEPMSVALVGGVLVLTAGVMRRKQRKQQTSKA